MLSSKGVAGVCLSVVVAVFSTGGVVDASGITSLGFGVSDVTCSLLLEGTE